MKVGFAVALASCVPAQDPRPASAPVAVRAAAAASGAHIQRFIAANPLVSRGRPVKGWSPREYSEPGSALDGDRTTHWDAGEPTPDRAAWLSIDLGRGPGRALLVWSAAGSFNYDETDYGSPGAFRIEASSDSSDGQDGAWTTVADAPGVSTHGGELAFDFAGFRWVKFVVTAAPSRSPNGVQIDRIDVHDISAGASDTWFFMGDSITAFAFGQSVPRGAGFADDVQRQHPEYYPAVINGGVGGDKSGDGVEHVDAWLRQNPDARFWAIGYGSNDSAGDSTDTTSFRKNMQTIIDRIRGAGHVPILARIPYATDGQHSTIPRFNDIVDELQRENSLPMGPDLYRYFRAHPDQLRDGLHPDQRGIEAINRLWAAAVDPLYAGRPGGR